VLLSTAPSISLAQIRAEHDSVFGTDLGAVESKLSEQPRLLNRLPYTKAGIKETPRLFPAAASIRQGFPGEDLVAEDGTRYPTDNTMILLLRPVIGRLTNYWPKPDDFIPERWLAQLNNELYPPEAAWRSFE